MIFPEIKETPGTPPRYYFETEEFEGLLFVDIIGSGGLRDLMSFFEPASWPSYKTNGVKTTFSMN